MERKGKIAITFDDGPYPALSEQLLDGLKEESVKATFFLLGQNCAEYPEVVKRIHQDGHLIGNHTYHHVQLTTIPQSEAVKEITETNELLYEITGEYPQFIRSPYGCWNESLDEQVEMFHIKWTLDPLDWCRTDTECIVRNVMNEVKDNDIILFHDCYPSSVEAALRVVKELKEQGYEFVTVEELLLD